MKGRYIQRQGGFDMSYPSSVSAIICYIEAHIKDEKFNYNELLIPNLTKNFTDTKKNF